MSQWWGWANFQTTPTTLPIYPKTTLFANFGNFCPISLKIGGDYYIKVKNTWLVHDMS